MRAAPATMRRRLRDASLAVAVVALSACGVDVAGSATTVVGVSPTAFATIPPLITTIAPTTTTLPIGAVGVEQTYTVRPGDGAILVANLYGITVAELLAWNGLVSVEQFPFPGSVLKIPPTAMISNPTVPIGPDATAKPSEPGCGPRPAGTYRVAEGDSISGIRQKFCVSTEALLAANGWISVDVIIFPGQTINIPAAGS